MIVAIIRLLLVLFPIILFGLWLHHRLERRRKKDVSVEEQTKQMRSVAFMGMVVILFMIVAGIVVSVTDEEMQGKYIPPQEKNGKVIPGRVQ